MLHIIVLSFWRTCCYTIYQHTVLCLVAQSCLTVWDLMDCSPPGSSVHGDFSPGKNTGVGCYALLQGIFPTQGLNLGLSHCKQILYCLSHQRSPRILEWVAYPFSRGTSQPRNWTQVSCIEVRFCTREAHQHTTISIYMYIYIYIYTYTYIYIFCLFCFVVYLLY